MAIHNKGQHMKLLLIISMLTVTLFANNDTEQIAVSIINARKQIRLNNQSLKKGGLTAEQVLKMEQSNKILLKIIDDLNQARRAEISKRWQSYVKPKSELIVKSGPKSGRKIHKREF